jgi:hypothetical protein
MCKNIAPSKNFKIVGMIDGFDVDKRWNPSSVGYQGYRLSDDPSLNILTHANYGGIGCNLDGSVTLWDDPKLKETVAMAHGKTPQIKVLGRFYADGPTATSAFSTTTNYNRLVQQLLNLVSNYDLDGLDIDIEGDVTSSGIGCNSRRVCLETFLLDLRNRMPPGKLLTIDSGYGTGSYDPSATFINTNLDWINVMSYDFATWYGIFDELEKQSPYPNMYHSLYEDVVLVMNNWIAQGVDRDKIVMGVPTYVVDGDRTHTSYKDVVDKINPPSSQDLATGISSISTFWNDGTLAVTYGRLWWNGIDTVKKKVNFVAANDLGGVMFCSMGFDALNNPKSLTQAAYNTLMQYSTTPTCSSPSYPSDRWQRVWYTHSTFACLGNSPDETNVQFDNNWAEGTVAYSMTDDIEFHSSRTINIPTTGTYTFSLGSDDGARLFIDGVSQMDQLVDQPYTINTKDIYLTAGNHLFQINYYENGGAARVTFSYVAKTTPTLTVFHFATVIAYGDTQIREHVNQFNTIAGKTLYGYDTWAGQYPNGWGADWAYLLGSGSQGVLPLFQDGTLKALALVWTPTVDQDQQTQKEIIAGKWDSYIRSIADECKAFGYPIYIRFGGEMNILQQPSQWAANPTDFVNTWKHVVDVFRAKGVTNVQWVWNPNWADDPDGTINFREYYPGDDYVDWVAIDMYQYGYGPDYAWWSDPEYELNGRNGDSIYDEYAPRKPIAICEYATNGYQWEGNQETDTPDAERADWLTKFFNAVEARPQIKWIGYYYAYNGHWAFDSSTPLTTAVYQQRIANPMYVGAEPTTSATFVEACDTFDTSIWTYEWAPPKVQNGEWIYNLPAGVVTRIVPRSVKENYFGYGHYKVRFRTSGPRVAPNIYSSFFYHTGASGSYNELDIPELNGAHSSTTMSISTFHNSNLDSGGNPIDNKDYRYFTSSINFEDTAYHMWEWDWLPSQVRFWVDGIEQDIDPNDGVGVLPWTSTLIAEPPTIFYPMSVGPYPSETTPPATSWTLYVDQIEYTPVTTTPSSCSSPSYPTDRWQRTWNVYSTGACLGNGPDETNVQFDNDWSTGTVAYGLSDDIEFQSSRTINLPAGTYTFTLSSDDGARLWIDDTLYIGSWVDRAYTTDTVDVSLTAGNHRFRIEYYENGGAARVTFSYTAKTSGITPTHILSVIGTTVDNSVYYKQVVGGTKTSSNDFSVLFDSIPDGAVVQILPGTYYLPDISGGQGSGILMYNKHDISIYGAPGVVFKSAMPTPTIVSQVIDMKNSVNVQFYDITFDMDYPFNPNNKEQADTGLSWVARDDSGVNNGFTRCQFINSGGNGFVIGNSVGLHLVDCTFNHLNEHTLYISGGTNDLHVEGCKFYNYGKLGRGYGPKIQESYNLYFDNCYFEPNQDGSGFTYWYITPSETGARGPIIANDHDIFFSNCKWVSDGKLYDGVPLIFYPMYIQTNTPSDNINFNDCTWVKWGVGWNSQPVFDNPADPYYDHNKAELHLTNCIFSN